MGPSGKRLEPALGGVLANLTPVVVPADPAGGGVEQRPYSGEDFPHTIDDGR